MQAHFRHTLLAAMSMLALTAGAAAQAGAAPLDEARRLLAARQEQEVRQGGGICVEQNSAESVEVLLETFERMERRTHLHLAPGHYRDIVWESLTKITDPYARKRVELELKKSKNPRVRQWCAELLGIYGDASFGDSLRRALRDRDEGVKRWAARSLGMMKYENAAADVRKLVRHKNDYVRANAIEAIARLDAASVQGFCAAIANDKSGGVRCALLGAAPEVAVDRTEALSTAALSDQDWRPRMQAVQNLGRIRTKSAVDALIAALDDARPVVAARAQSELQELTGQPIRQRDVWQKWWTENRATFAFPEGRGVRKSVEGTVTYNGLPVESDHVAFLLDKSFMMKERLKSKNTSKRDAAQAEFERVLQLLQDKITINVFNYHTEVEAMAKKPARLTSGARKKAVRFASAEAAGKAKDIWQVLERVIADPTLDTAYLLSSGEPDTGLYVHYNRVTRHLRDLNRFHKITVHTVAYSSNKWYRDQLEKIAEVTGGHFTFFE